MCSAASRVTTPFRGHGGSDELFGDNGFDNLDGGLGDDKLYGGFGPDQLFSSHVGTVRFLGGGQRDVIVISQGSGTAGDDVMDVGSRGTWTMLGDDGPDSLTARGTANVRLDTVRMTTS
jgi:serralysin